MSPPVDLCQKKMDDMEQQLNNRICSVQSGVDKNVLISNSAWTPCLWLLLKLQVSVHSTENSATYTTNLSTGTSYENRHRLRRLEVNWHSNIVGYQICHHQGFNSKVFINIFYIATELIFTFMIETLRFYTVFKT